MPDPCKQFLGVGSLISEFHTLVSPFRARRTKIFAYGFLAAFAVCTAFLAFNPPEAGSSPWFDRLFSTSVSGSYRSQVSSLFSRYFPGSDSGSVALDGDPLGDEAPPSLTVAVPSETGVSNFTASLARRNVSSGVLENPINGSDSVPGNRTQKGLQSGRDEIAPVSDNSSSPNKATKKSSDHSLENGANQIQVSDNPQKNGTNVKKMNFDHSQKNQSTPMSDNSKKNEKKADSGSQKSKNVSNLVSDNSQRNKTTETGKQKSGVVVSNTTTGKALEKPRREVSLDSMRKCNIFEGGWVKDDSYPLYKEGSCPHVDEPFDCFLNGRPDRDYQKLRWQPNGCNIPRLNGTDMLERLRGKRLVFVGDSLNRNMWESLVCVLRNSVQDKRKVFEASGRREFRTEGAYSFLFKDYNCSVEFFRSPFLVQEWENPEPNGSKKETLRLDLIERKSDKYKQADIIVFNTGHWWTHEKTSLGKDYYQEGSHVYGQLNVVEAFRKALVTWARWVDSNVNRNKTLVFFRGYSASHFSGGQWNSGGGCDSETLPIYNKTYLSQYPEKMYVLENVIKGMKTPISYLNITRMTDYRKDAHPSIYRKRDLTNEERRSPERYQDCSHWCLPGVPDSWNELLYAQLLIKLQ